MKAALAPRALVVAAFLAGPLALALPPAPAAPAAPPAAAIASGAASGSGRRARERCSSTALRRAIVSNHARGLAPSKRG